MTPFFLETHTRLSGGWISSPLRECLSRPTSSSPLAISRSLWRGASGGKGPSLRTLLCSRRTYPSTSRGTWRKSTTESRMHGREYRTHRDPSVCVTHTPISTGFVQRQPPSEFTGTQVHPPTARYGLEFSIVSRLTVVYLPLNQVIFKVLPIDVPVEEKPYWVFTPARRG